MIRCRSAWFASCTGEGGGAGEAGGGEAGGWAGGGGCCPWAPPKPRPTVATAAAANHTFERAMLADMSAPGDEWRKSAERDAFYWIWRRWNARPADATEECAPQKNTEEHAPQKNTEEHAAAEKH
jgi:hypothetical protein